MDLQKTQSTRCAARGSSARWRILLEFPRLLQMVYQLLPALILLNKVIEAKAFRRRVGGRAGRDVD